MMNLEQKRKRIETIAQVVALGVVAFFVAPFILLTIQGLIGLIISFAIGAVGIAFIPWFSSVVANWRLKAIKYEASKNPIETLQNDYALRRQNLLAFADSIRTGAAGVASFRDKLDSFKKQYPDEAEKFDEQLAQMVALLNLRKEKYNQTVQSLNRYEGEIKKAEAIWTLAQAAAEMNKSANASDEFISKIQSETALDAVQNGLNSAFADLELSLLDEDATKANLPKPTAKAIRDAKKSPVVKTTVTTAKSDLDLGV